MPSYRFGPYSFDPRTARLLKGGTRVRLQNKPRQLLQLLLEHVGQSVTREQLRAFLWPNEAYRDFETGLNVAVKKLRDALCDSADEPVYIATEIGVGYRFIAAVEQHTSESRSALPAGPSPETPAPVHSPDFGVLSHGLRRRAASIALVAASLLAFFLIHASAVRKTGHVTTRSTFGPPPGWEFLTTGDAGGSVALSPDGRKVVYVARNAKTATMLFLRPLDSLVSEGIPGTEGASMPFWSPDSSHVAFFDNVAQLKAVNLSNRKVSTICDSQRGSPRGGSWGADNIIVFAASTRTPIYKVPASGGTPSPVTSLDGSAFTTHRWPRFLPDGKHFLFLAANHEPVNSTKSAVMIGSTDSSPARFVLESDSDAAFVNGSLLFAAGGKLIAQAFDPDTGTLGSSAKVLVENIEVDHSLWHATFDANHQALIYRPRPDTPDLQILKWYDESGNLVRVASKPGVFRGVRASPNGAAIAAMCDEPELNICLAQEDGALTRVSDRPINYGPVWSPDASQIAFGTHRGVGQLGPSGLAIKDTAGKLPEHALAATNDGIGPTSWSPDGRELIVERTGPSGKEYLSVFSLSSLKFRDLIRSAADSPADVRDGRFSPDGKWIAFYSNETGQDEVYVSRIADPSRKSQVSRDGGHSPRWGPDGRTLYFLDLDDSVIRAQLSLSKNGIQVGSLKALFHPDLIPPPYDRQSFDFSAVRQLFLINSETPQRGSDFVLVTSWQE